MVYLYEVKKIITQKSWIVAMACSFLLIVGMLTYEVYSHGLYNQEGVYETGIAETRQLVSLRQEMNGEMSVELVQEVLLRYEQLVSDEQNYNSFGEFDEQKIAYLYQGFRELHHLYMCSLPTLSKLDIRKMQAEDIMKLQASDVLLSRKQLLVSMLDQKETDGKEIYNSLEKAKIVQMGIDKMDKMDIKQYEDATGWNALFAHLGVMNGAILMIAAMIGSTLFCKEITRGTATLLYTTRKGRSTAVISKILAAFSVVGVSAILLHGLYALGILWIFTPSGATTIIQYQSMYWLSIFPLTNLQAYGFQIALGLCGGMVTLIFAMVCSRFTRKEHHALIVSLLFVLIPYLYPFSYAIFPSDMSNATTQLMSKSVHSFFQYVLFDYELQLLVLLFSFSFLLLIYYTYQRKRKFIILE